MAKGRVSCNLVFVTIDQLDLCAITSPFQSTVVIMPLGEREGERERDTDRDGSGPQLHRQQIPE